MEAGGLATGYAYDCRAGASPADPSNGKRERLPYKSVVESEVSDQTSDRVKASLTRRCQRSEVGKRNDGEAPRYRLLLLERRIRPKCLDGGLNFSMIERGRFGPTDEG